MTRYASVYPLVTARALAREFTYEIPDDVGPGAVVEVRFGNSKQRGVVTEVDVQPPKGIDTSPVERVVEELPRPLVELALWVADYYGSTPGRALAPKTLVTWGIMLGLFLGFATDFILVAAGA